MRISDWSSDVCSSDLQSRRGRSPDLRQPGTSAAQSDLLLFPAAAGLVPPAGLRAGDPLFRKHLADLRFPLRVLVGDRDLAIDRARVAVLVGDRLVDGDPLGQRDLRGVAHRDLAVAGEAQGAGIEVDRKSTRLNYS